MLYVRRSFENRLWQTLFKIGETFPYSVFVYRQVRQRFSRTYRKSHRLAAAAAAPGRSKKWFIRLIFAEYYLFVGRALGWCRSWSPCHVRIHTYIHTYLFILWKILPCQRRGVKQSGLKTENNRAYPEFFVGRDVLITIALPYVWIRKRQFQTGLVKIARTRSRYFNILPNFLLNCGEDEGEGEGEGIGGGSEIVSAYVHSGAAIFRVTSECLNFWSRLFK